MVKADNMTPEEALQYLKKQQRRTAERQKEFAQRMKAEGFKRLTTWISKEAWKALERLRKHTGRTTGDIVGEALVMSDSHNQSEYREVTSNAPSGYDRELTKARIKVLRSEGKTLEQIMEVLEQEGYKNSKGKVSWHKSTVSRLLNED